MKVEASVVIPNWNGLDLLKICLPSLKKQSFSNFEIIIVENGSTDGSAEYIEKYFPEIKIIKLSRNIGFSPAVNLGIKKAKGKYIILVNNDAELDKDCLYFLTKAAKDHPRVSFVAAKILNFYRRNIIDSAGDEIDMVGHAVNTGMGEKDGESFSQGKEVFLVCGGGSLFKKEAFKKVGLFDGSYFAYFEDVDWCLRAQLLGLKGYFEPRAKLYHIQKATSSRIKHFAEYLHFRNMTMTVLKDFPKGVLLHKLNWLKILLVNINTIRFLALQGYLKEALRAEWYILTHLGEILEKRKKIQEKRVVEESYIINNIKEKKITFFGLIPGGI